MKLFPNCLPHQVGSLQNSEVHVLRAHSVKIPETKNNQIINESTFPKGKKERKTCEADLDSKLFRVLCFTFCSFLDIFHFCICAENFILHRLHLLVLFLQELLLLHHKLHQIIDWQIAHILSIWIRKCSSFNTSPPFNRLENGLMGFWVKTWLFGLSWNWNFCRIRKLCTSICFFWLHISGSTIIFYSAPVLLFARLRRCRWSEPKILKKGGIEGWMMKQTNLTCNTLKEKFKRGTRTCQEGIKY